MTRFAVAAGVLFACRAVVLSAQSAVPSPLPSAPASPAPPHVERHVNVTVLRDGPADGGAPMVLPGGSGFDFLTMPLAVGGDPVAGAPYSADAVTEVVQTLADGNRIVRQNTAALFRDSKGRTRREQGLAVLGNLVGGADARTQIQIHDPETGTMYLLDPQARTAHRLPAPRVHITKTDGGPEPMLATVEMTQAVDAGHRVAVFRRREGSDGGTVEALGRRSIEGVDTEGSRTTVVIPAGQIGNEQPISIVSERWYSPELKLLIMSRQSDPRYGDTIYRLTNLVRAEPGPELFQVPGDFRTIEGASPAGDAIRIRRQRE